MPFGAVGTVTVKPPVTAVALQKELVAFLKILIILPGRVEKTYGAKTGPVTVMKAA